MLLSLSTVTNPAHTKNYFHRETSLKRAVNASLVWQPHCHVKDYLSIWPSAKTIGVTGLDGKRKDMEWSIIYTDRQRKPEDVFEFVDDVETVMFKGFITYAVAWYHKPAKTLIQSDLMMNLPCTEVCFL